MLTNFRTGNAKDQIEALADVGLLQIPVVRQLEAEWFASNPQPQAVPATVTPAQGVANVMAGLGAQPVAETPAPPGGRPGDGDLHPTKTCAICHAARRVVDRPKKDDPSKRYRKLECSVDYKHKPDDWSENYK